MWSHSRCKSCARDSFYNMCPIVPCMKTALDNRLSRSHGCVNASASRHLGLPLLHLLQLSNHCRAPYITEITTATLCGLAVSPHRRSTSLSLLLSLFTLLMHTLGEQLSILGRSILRSLCSPPLECDAMTLVLDTLWSDEALNLRCFGVRLGSFFLWDDFSSNDELAVRFVSSHSIMTL